MLKTTVMKKTFFIILSFAAAISCSETLRPDSDNNVAISRQQETSTPNYHIGLETALESLDEFIATMDGTKSNSDRIRIADVLRFGRHPGTTVKSTESTDTSTILYVVNFEDDAGYAVLAADSRLPVDVYAVTEKGRVDRNDLYPDQDGEFNPLALIHASAAGHLHVTDSLGFGPNEDQFPKLHPFDTLLDIWAGEWVTTRWGPWRNDKNIPIMLKTRWHQREPFNNYVKPNAAGCTTIALFQLMAYNEYPANHTINGIHIPYSDLKKIAYINSGNPVYANEVATFVLNFHNRYMDLHFDESTLIFPTAAKKYLESVGYTNVNLSKNSNKCDASTIYNSLNKGYPVLISAKSNGLNAHTWVIDGYIRQYRTGVKIGEETEHVYGRTLEIREFVHCNWGWQGYNDGYFYMGIFDSNNPISTNEIRKTSEDNGYYKSFYRIITYELP